jgi:hypothetical protein
MYLFEWAVHIYGRGIIAPVGVTDREWRARRRLLEALHEVPPGTGASGWLTLMGLPPFHDWYERYQTVLILDRTPDGRIRRTYGTGKPLDVSRLLVHMCCGLLRATPCRKP